jgi:hypothetical protein
VLGTKKRWRSKRGEVARDTTFGGGGGEARNDISSFDGSQAMPTCPSDIGNANNRNWCFYTTLERLHYSGILTNIRRAILERNFDVTNGRAACEAGSATRNLVSNSAFALRARKPTESLDRIGRSQELPDANRLLSNSPALNTRNLTLKPTGLLHRFLLIWHGRRRKRLFQQFFYCDVCTCCRSNVA